MGDREGGLVQLRKQLFGPSKDSTYNRKRYRDWFIELMRQQTNIFLMSLCLGDTIEKLMKEYRERNKREGYT